MIAGDDAFIAPTMSCGAVGAIAAAGHVCTPAFAALVAAALAGDVARTRRLAASLLPVVQAGFAEPNPAVWKAALHHAGEIATPHLRAPMTPASPQALERLLATVVAAVGGLDAPR